MLRILTYHRVIELTGPSVLNPRLVSATPAAFEQQMQWLTRHFHAIPVEHVLEAIERKISLHPQAVLVTFDDAYRDFSEEAWPVLKRYRIPATLFVPTAFPGKASALFWWDRLYTTVFRTTCRDFFLEPFGTLSLKRPEERQASYKKIQSYIKSLPHDVAMDRVEKICGELDVEIAPQPLILDWDDLRRLSREGVSLGAHSQTHPVLCGMRPHLIRQEVRGAQEDLRREIGHVLPIFSYPSGAYDETVVEILSDEGIRAGFTTEDGHNDFRTVDPLRLRRTGITRRTTPFVFRLRLTRWGACLDRLRRRNGQRPQVRESRLKV